MIALDEAVFFFKQASFVGLFFKYFWFFMLCIFMNLTSKRLLSFFIFSPPVFESVLVSSTIIKHDSILELQVRDVRMEKV